MTGYVGEVGLVPSSPISPLLNQRVGKFVLTNTGASGLAFCYCFARRSEFKEAVKSASHGTAQANVSAQSILAIPAIIPSNEVGGRFNQLCESVFNKMLSNFADIVSLQETRDTLLPKLISGQIRIPDIEEAEGAIE
jgi:type I restriction enzyme, S subunit